MADSVAIVEAEDEDGVADSELVRDALLGPLREIGVETGVMPCVRLATMRTWSCARAPFVASRTEFRRGTGSLDSMHGKNHGAAMP